LVNTIRKRRKCGAFHFQNPVERCVAFKVVGGMPCATIPPLSPQGAFERHDKFLATLNASIIALARPQRQCALQIVGASGLRIEAAAR
jgi:hypothetical protein